MTPADQRLHADHGAAGQVQLRLVVQLELAAGEPVAQVSLKGQALDGACAQPLAVELVVVPALLFGMVHRDVGVLQQNLRIVAVVRKDRDADAGADDHGLATDVERLVEPLEHALGDPHGIVGAVDLAQHDRELVAAETRQGRGRTFVVQPGDDVGIAQTVDEALGEPPQQAVARVVTEGVVDQLEAVEIEEQERPRRR